jgi:predicted metal-dependent phosphoesterase TrpH
MNITYILFRWHFSPKEAVELKLVAIGITDYDSIDGIDEQALNCSLQSSIEIIHGIELFSEVELESEKSEIHILGYYYRL